jgi:hypothetical protein
MFWGTKSIRPDSKVCHRKKDVCTENVNQLNLLTKIIAVYIYIWDTECREADES